MKKHYIGQSGHPVPFLLHEPQPPTELLNVCSPISINKITYIFQQQKILFTFYAMWNLFLYLIVIIRCVINFNSGAVQPPLGLSNQIVSSPSNSNDNNVIENHNNIEDNSDRNEYVNNEEKENLDKVVCLPSVN